MSKIDDAKTILKSVLLPRQQQNDMCARTLLALAGLKEDDFWESSSNDYMRIHDIISFIGNNYDFKYAENSRETFRKQALKPFRMAAIITDNGESTNSPNYKYHLTDEFLDLISSYENVELYPIKTAEFIHNNKTLQEHYSSHRAVSRLPVRINNQEIIFSPGKHNILQKAIIEKFAPRFAPSSECLYIGDTSERSLIQNNDKMSSLGFSLSIHTIMPDVILYREDKNWLYFIEAVTSVGPMSAERVNDIKKMTQNCNSGLIFITAFPDFKTFKKFSEQLAWDTEVWISELPEHMIHMNGDKFMGPHC